MPAPTSDSALVELLQRLIRNRCVNDGTPASGHEARNAAVLEEYLDGCGFEFTRFEPEPDRTTLVATLRGTDPAAASLCLMGHIDVVPVSEAGWSRDPFGAELVDGVVWGRGALDMLNQTAAQAVAARRLVESGFRPRGDLVLIFPADEEAGGGLGVGWIATHDPGVITTTWLVTEGGGFHLPWLGPTPPPRGRRPVCVAVGEKGPMWFELRATGTPGHASIPFRADSATAKLAAAALALDAHTPDPRFDTTWGTLIDALGVDAATRAALCDRGELLPTLEALATRHPVEAAVLHASCHTTYSVNVLVAGTKINVIAAEGRATLDVRTLPETSVPDLLAEIESVLGSNQAGVTVKEIATHPATRSPAAGPLWDAVATASRDVLGPVDVVPWVTPFATDARFLRQLGTTAYGATLHDDSLDLATWLSLFHGNDERVSVQALSNAALFYEALARRLLS